MRAIGKIVLIISLSLNIYLIYKEIKIQRNKEVGRSIIKHLGYDLKGTGLKENIKIFREKLEVMYPKTVGSKYYYINIWNIMCKPCIKEMPFLDSLSRTLRKDVAYIFVSDNTEEFANKCMERLNYNITNFVYLNDMNDFVSAICNEKNKGSKIYPMELILDEKGKIYHCSTGAYENAKEAQEFVDLINKLP